MHLPVDSFVVAGGINQCNVNPLRGFMRYNSLQSCEEFGYRLMGISGQFHYVSAGC